MLEMKGDHAEGHSTHILTHDSEGVRDGVMVGGGERACAAAAAFNHVKDEGGDGGCGLARSVFRKVEPRRLSIHRREGKAPRER